MDLAFHGEVADFYQQFRRGYPPPVIDALCQVFRLTREDIVVDLGCGTGQLALPVAGRVRGVVGVDPEPDMLLRARQTSGNACGTDEASQRRYAVGLAAAGYQVSRASVGYDDELTLDQIVGGVYSALEASQLPPAAQRPEVTRQIRTALAAYAPYFEHIQVSLVCGII